MSTNNIGQWMSGQTSKGAQGVQTQQREQHNARRCYMPAHTNTHTYSLVLGLDAGWRDDKAGGN